MVVAPSDQRFKMSDTKVRIVLKDGNDFSNSLPFIYKAEPDGKKTKERERGRKKRNLEILSMCS